MSSILRDLGIDRLSLDQRLDLMHEIWESISAEGGRNPLSEARRIELESRLAEHIASPDAVFHASRDPETWKSRAKEPDE